MRRPTHTNAGDPICARLRVYVRKLVGSVLPRPGGVRETQKCQVQRRLVASKFRVTNGYPLAQTWCVACVELILLPNKSARAEPEACMWRSWHHDLVVNRRPLHASLHRAVVPHERFHCTCSTRYVTGASLFFSQFWPEFACSLTAYMNSNSRSNSGHQRKRALNSAAEITHIYQHLAELPHVTI